MVENLEIGMGKRHTCICHPLEKSIVDYILISSSLFEQIIDFSVEDQTNSDHFPLKM